MDKWQAQYDFWNSFGIPAYDETNVPDDAPFPRITYEAASSTFENLVSITANIWTRSTSWEQAQLIANNIGQYILNQGRTVELPYGFGTVTVDIPVCKEIDGGYMRIFIGQTTFAQTMLDPEDDQIRRILLNVNLEFMTNK